MSVAIPNDSEYAQNHWNFLLVFFFTCFSRDYLRDNPHLVREDSASYLTLWCVNLEMQEVSVVPIIISISFANRF